MAQNAGNAEGAAEDVPKPIDTTAWLTAASYDIVVVDYVEQAICIARAAVKDGQ